jgi:hypothetical protein
MSIQTEIHLDKFKPRDFQLEACDAFENLGFKKMLLIWPRRARQGYCLLELDDTPGCS